MPYSSDTTANEARSDSVVLGRLLSLARTATSTPLFIREAVREVAVAFESSFALAYLRCSASVIREEWRPGGVSPDFWRAPVDEQLNRAIANAAACGRRYSARAANLQVALIAAPLRNALGDADGAIALVVNLEQQTLSEQLRRLEQFANTVSAAVGTVGAAGSATSGDRTALRGAARVGASQSPTALAFEIVNGLRNKLRCEEVALARVKRHHAKVLAVSGRDAVAANSPTVRAMTAALAETIDFREPIVSPADDQWSNGAARFRLHAAWSDTAGHAPVASIPILDEHGPIAVLALRRGPGEQFADEELKRVREVATPLIAALPLVERAHRNVARHACDAVGDAGRWVMRPASHGKKVALGLAIAGMIWLLTGSLAWRVTAPAVLEPAAQRTVAAPFAAVIADVRVAPGDRVAAGDILCVFDREDIKLEHARLVAEGRIASHEEQRALAAGEPVEAQLAAARVELLAAERALVTQRLELAIVRSPIDGVVLEGELSPRVGAAVALGEPLFSVAPGGDWRVRVSAPARIAGGLSVGMQGVFATEARPEDAAAFRIETVHPAVSHDPTSTAPPVVTAIAVLESEPAWARAGMQGRVQLNLGDRPIWWLSIHRITDYLRLRFWL